MAKVGKEEGEEAAGLSLGTTIKQHISDVKGLAGHRQVGPLSRRITKSQSECADRDGQSSPGAIRTNHGALPQASREVGVRFRSEWEPLTPTIYSPGPRVNDDAMETQALQLCSDLLQNVPIAFRLPGLFRLGSCATPIAMVDERLTHATKSYWGLNLQLPPVHHGR
ncbi:unnamed protein product [Caretta caretta]